MISIFEGLFDPFTGTLGVGTAIAAIVIGLVSLFFGRRIYWVFVGIAGFLLGLIVGPILFSGLDPSWQPWIYLILAVVFALLSIFLNKLMIAISGAIGLGIIVFLFTQPYLQQWAAITLAVVGGIIGLIISWLLFAWALMIFSSLVGASLAASGIAALIPDIAGFDWLIFILLFVIGLIFQIVQWSKEQSMQESANRETVVKEQVIVVEDEEENEVKEN